MGDDEQRLETRGGGVEDGRVKEGEAVGGTGRIARLEAGGWRGGDDVAPVDGDAHHAPPSARTRVIASVRTPASGLSMSAPSETPRASPVRGKGPYSRAWLCTRDSDPGLRAGGRPAGGSTPKGRGGPSAPEREGSGRTAGGCSQATVESSATVLRRPFRAPLIGTRSEALGPVIPLLPPAEGSQLGA